MTLTTGTEKQITWAEQIIAETHDYRDKIIASQKQRIADREGSPRQAFLIDGLAKLERAFDLYDTITDASVIIDNRQSVSRTLSRAHLLTLVECEDFDTLLLANGSTVR